MYHESPYCLLFVSLKLDEDLSKAWDFCAKSKNEELGLLAQKIYVELWALRNSARNFSHEENFKAAVRAVAFIRSSAFDVLKNTVGFYAHWHDF